MSKLENNNLINFYVSLDFIISNIILFIINDALWKLRFK